MLRLLIPGLALLLATASPCPGISFITTESGDFLVGPSGERLLSMASSTHSTLVLSSWPMPIDVSLSIIAQYTDDLTGIMVMGFSSNPTTTKTEIQTVDSAGRVKTVATCQSQRCDFVIAKSTMRAGSNDIWFLATLANGKKYGATTKMSPP